MGNATYDDHERVIRSLWLNYPFFYFRYAGYFAYFILAGFWFRRMSVRQDDDGSPVYTRRMHDHSYLALVIFGLGQTFLGNDWLSNLDWKWASSLFGVYNFAVIAQAGLAGGIVVIALYQRAGYLLTINHEHFYLMGKLLFGFTIFWGYVAFGQYMLIWYANIPDETIFYNDHNRGYWIYFTYFLAVGKFVFPVFFLLAQDNKKSLKRAGRPSRSGFSSCTASRYTGSSCPYAHMGSVLPRAGMDFVSFLTIGSILAFAYVRICGWALASSLPRPAPGRVPHHHELTWPPTSLTTASSTAGTSGSRWPFAFSRSSRPTPRA